MNVEIDGIVGNVEVKADKKTGLPVLNVLLMDNKGKQVKARVKQVDDKISMLKFGHPVQLRFENLANIRLSERPHQAVLRSGILRLFRNVPVA